MYSDRDTHTGAYAPIAEHGLIGNLQSAALVDTRGTVDWYCPGRFDAPSVFASLLDPENAGDTPEAELTRIQDELSDSGTPEGETETAKQPGEET